MKRVLSIVAIVAVSGLSAAAPIAIDRTAVRFDAPEMGGPSRPQFVFERELAFEARLEALADSDRTERKGGYVDRHVRSALERHIAEELLAHLPMDPEPDADDVARRLGATRALLEQRVGGAVPLAEAAKAEGVGTNEIHRFVVREARASLYLDRMVAPMLAPSEAELREVHRSANNPFRGQRFDEIEKSLRQWFVSQRLEAALAAFYQNARSRVHVVIIPRE
ncbi:MAG: hypothetical protein ABW133_03475 [Polyangiaceae bacterium]